MGVFKNKDTTPTVNGGTLPEVVVTAPKTPTDTPTDNGGSSGGFLDGIKGIFGIGGSSGSNKVNNGAGDTVSSVVSSLSNVASAWINGDANKKVAQAQIEASKLQADAEASKADQELYKALKAKADVATANAVQLASTAKSNNTTNFLIVGGVLLLAFGVIYLVFKAVFGWVSPPRGRIQQPVPVIKQ